jgi:hypothetical protein
VFFSCRLHNITAVVFHDFVNCHFVARKPPSSA